MLMAMMEIRPVGMAVFLGLMPMFVAVTIEFSFALWVVMVMVLIRVIMGVAVYKWVMQVVMGMALSEQDEN